MSGRDGCVPGNLEGYLRALLREEVRAVVREELAALGDRGRVPEAPAEDRYLTDAEAAKIAGVHAQTIRRWRQQGLLTSCSAGNRPRTRRSDLDALMARNRKTGEEFDPRKIAKALFAPERNRRSA